MSSSPAALPAFAALRQRGYQLHFSTYLLAMMGDNIEHVISYWVAFQKFHSPALGGFAVVSHWLPYLLFSVPAGALADRLDPRRIIQAGMLMFIAASLGWGWLFVTDTLRMWEAALLLVLHGCAGVLWQTSSQLLLHDIVGTEVLPSAVRLNATARYLGVLVGPAVGGLLMLELGPAHGILVNALFYMPLVVWLWKAPYGHVAMPRRRPPRRAMRGFSDILDTLRDIAPDRVLVSMIGLAGTASFFVGNSYQAQMPNFALDLGLAHPDSAYSALLAADAAGGLVAGFALEAVGNRSNPRSALLLAMLWAIALVGFATAHSYTMALVLLFTAGFFELSFNSTVQTVVQLQAPAAIRGRVIGLFNMSSLGLRAFSGIAVGLVGSLAGVHGSLAGAALCVLAATLVLRRWATAPAN